MHVSNNTQFMFCILAMSLHLPQITYGGYEGTSNQLSCTLIYTHSPVATIINSIHIYRDGENGPAALVLAGPIFLKVKNESPFLHKVSNKQ